MGADTVFPFSNGNFLDIFNMQWLGKTVTQGVTTTLTLDRDYPKGTFLFTCASISSKNIKLNGVDISDALTDTSIYYTQGYNVNGKIWIPPSDLELYVGDIVTLMSGNGGNTCNGLLYIDL